jgi:hypothetical protein
VIAEAKGEAEAKPEVEARSRAHSA